MADQERKRWKVRADERWEEEGERGRGAPFSMEFLRVPLVITNVIIIKIITVMMIIVVVIMIMIIIMIIMIYIMIITTDVVRV